MIYTPKAATKNLRRLSPSRYQFILLTFLADILAAPAPSDIQVGLHTSVKSVMLHGMRVTLTSISLEFLECGTHPTEQETSNVVRDAHDTSCGAPNVIVLGGSKAGGLRSKVGIQKRFNSSISHILVWYLLQGTQPWDPANRSARSQWRFYFNGFDIE